METHMRLNRVLTLVLILMICIPGALSESLDYSDPNNWAYYAIGDDKEIDVFMICPTVDMGRAGNYLMSVEDAGMRERFVGALNMERGIYDRTGTLYAPFYRQATFPVYFMDADIAETYLAQAYEDVRAAFLRFADETAGRPFVLAGFSQGSDMLMRLMRDIFDDDVYTDRLVAAYAIGWHVTQDDTTEYPWLKPAQGETDTGGIITFTTEAENVEQSAIIPRGMKSLSINPLNWEIDSTYADASLNMGACFTDYSGNITSEIPALTGAFIDETRGALKVLDIDAEVYSSQYFDYGVYHLYDYQFFYKNLQNNVAVRSKVYLMDAQDKQ